MAILIVISCSNELYGSCTIFCEDTEIHLCCHLNVHVSASTKEMAGRLMVFFRLIPIAIIGATRFYATLVNVLSE